MGAGLRYLLRDRFQATETAPMASPRNCSPGPGVLTITDVESTLKTLGGALRGGGQPTSAVWGECRLVSGAISRVQGRALCAVIIPQDYFNSDWWMAWATSATPTTPDTAGFGLRYLGPGMLDITAPGGVCRYANQAVTLQPEQILLALIQQSTGFYLLISAAGAYANQYATGAGYAGTFGDIPQYPNARLWWIDRADATAILYAALSFYNRGVNYPNNHAVFDLRVVDIHDAHFTIYNGLALNYDAFADADSTSLASHTPNIGGGWTLQATGTWAINSSSLTRTDAGSAWKLAYVPTPATDTYLIQCKVTMPASGANKFGIVLRRQDDSNYVMFSSRDGVSRIDKVVADSLSNISTSGYAWANNGATYDVRIYVSPTLIRVLRDATDIGVATTDNTFAANPGAGLTTLVGGAFGGGAHPSPVFDDFTVFPLTISLPSELRQGAIPTILTPGAIIASDTFTGAAGNITGHTPDAGPTWTVVTGTWALDGSGKVGLTAATGLDLIYQELNTSSVECSVDVTFPADVSHVTAGIKCYIDATHFFTARLIRDDVSQPTFHEIELIHVYDGYSDVCHKIGLGNFITAGATHTLKVQFTANMLHVFLDGNFVNSYIPPVAFGTKFGLCLENYNGNDNGSLFDNWTVKAL